MSLPKDDKPTSDSRPSNSGKEDNLGYCRHCDKLLEYKDTKFCPNCGKAVGDSSNNDTSTSIYEKPNVVRLMLISRR